MVKLTLPLLASTCCQEDSFTSSVTPSGRSAVSASTSGLFFTPFRSIDCMVVQAPCGIPATPQYTAVDCWLVVLEDELLGVLDVCWLGWTEDELELL